MATEETTIEKVEKISATGEGTTLSQEFKFLTDENHPATGALVYILGEENIHEFSAYSNKIIENSERLLNMVARREIDPADGTIDEIEENLSEFEEALDSLAVVMREIREVTDDDKVYSKVTELDINRMADPLEELSRSIDSVSKLVTDSDGNVKDEKINEIAAELVTETNVLATLLTLLSQSYEDFLEFSESVEEEHEEIEIDYSQVEAVSASEVGTTLANQFKLLEGHNTPAINTFIYALRSGEMYKLGYHFNQFAERVEKVLSWVKRNSISTESNLEDELSLFREELSNFAQEMEQVRIQAEDGNEDIDEALYDMDMSTFSKYIETTNRELKQIEKEITNSDFDHENSEVEQLISEALKDSSAIASSFSSMARKFDLFRSFITETKD